MKDFYNNTYWPSWKDTNEPLNDWSAMVNLYPRLTWVKKRLKKGASILDIGCGFGNIAIPLSLQGYKVTGLDISDYILKTARQKTILFNTKVNWIECDIFNYTSKKKYDGILAFYILEHVDAVGRLINKILSMLKDKGKAFLIFPNTADQGHIHQFNEQSVKDYLQGMNYQLVDDPHKETIWVMLQK